MLTKMKHFLEQETQGLKQMEVITRKVIEMLIKHDFEFRVIHDSIEITGLKKGVGR